MIVPLAANMPPTPWQTEILAHRICGGWATIPELSTFSAVIGVLGDGRPPEDRALVLRCPLVRHE
jgi:hypothetical protein